MSDFQVVGGTRRKPCKVELFTDPEKKSIYKRWRCHEKTMWMLAMEFKVQVSDIDDVIKSETRKELAKVEDDAYKAGRRSMMPNLAA